MNFFISRFHCVSRHFVIAAVVITIALAPCAIWADSTITIELTGITFDDTAGARGKFTSGNTVGMADIAVYLAWYINGGTSDINVVQNSARQLYPSGGDFIVEHLPVTSADDFNDDSARDMSDIAIMLAWLINGGTTDKELVTNQARILFPNLVGSASRLPGEAVTR